MKFLRALGLGALSLICALAVSVFIWAVTLQATVLNRHTVKSWLHQSDVYSRVIDNLVDLPTTAGATQTDLLTSGAFKTALAQTFTPAYIQQQTEYVIDSSYDWVEGKTKTLDFLVPINDKKTTFIAELSQALEPAVARLRVCTPADLAAPQEATCRPPGLSSAEFANRLASEGINRSNLLDQPLTEDQLTDAQRASGQTSQTPAILNQLPTYRQWLSSLLWILPTVVVLCLVVTYFLAAQKLRQFIRLARRIFFGSLFTLGAAILCMYLGNNPSLLPGLANQTNVAYELVIPVLQQCLQGVGKVLALWSGIVTLFSGSTWLGLWLIKRKQHHMSVPPSPQTPPVVAL